MSETHGYREDAREKRRAVIAFATTWRRFVGPFIGIALVGAMLYAALFLGERKVTFRCTRDERGAGTCEHVTYRVAWEDRETFDVRDVRGARVQLGQGKSGPTYRTFVDVGGAEKPLGDVNGDDEQLGVAAGIDHFAHDPTARTFYGEYGPTQQFVLTAVMSLLFVACGLVIAMGTRRMTAPRRLVLDEDANTATLERKLLLRWTKLWAVRLDTVRAARVVDGPKGFRNIVVDTKDDGALVADDAAGKDDPAVAEITRFLSRDPA